jgi:hypothetical protein
MTMIAFWIVVLVVIIVGGWWWRYQHVKDMANQFGLDPGDLMMKDIFGSEGAVERELATVALDRANAANRRAEREARERRASEERQRRLEQERHRAIQTTEVSIKPADRPRPARLSELNELEAQGLITPDVAAARRSEILKEI